MGKEFKKCQGLVFALFLGLGLSLTGLEASAQNTPVKNQKTQVTEAPVQKIYGVPLRIEGDSINETSFEYPEVSPVYKHGKEAGMHKFINANLNLVHKPEKGIVIYAVVIGTDGKVTDPELLKGIDPEVDKEVLRVIKQLQFIPGKQNLQVVPVRIVIPVRFGSN